MIFQIVLAFTLVSVVLGKGCCTPRQWEGTEYVEGGFTKILFRTGSIKDIFKISYDALNMRIAVSGKIFKEDVESTFKVIYNYNDTKGYFIQEETDECRSFPLRRRFQEFCIPDSAVLEGQSYLGVGSTALNVTSYRIQYKSEKAYLGDVVLVTSGSCVPVSEDIMGKYKSGYFFWRKFIMSATYAGITPGIKKESVFTPPPDCTPGVEDVSDDFYEQYSTMQFTHPGVANMNN